MSQAPSLPLSKTWWRSLTDRCALGEGPYSGNATRASITTAWSSLGSRATVSPSIPASSFGTAYARDAGLRIGHLLLSPCVRERLAEAGSPGRSEDGGRQAITHLPGSNSPQRPTSRRVAARLQASPKCIEPQSSAREIAIIGNASALIARAGSVGGRSNVWFDAVQ